MFWTPTWAKDIAQEVFIKLWEKRKSLFIKTNIQSYLLSATRNMALNHLRKNKTYYEHLDRMGEEKKSGDTPESVLESKELEKIIFEAIDAIATRRCKSIFLLRKVDGLSIREIADQLVISPKTVENQITKAIKKFDGAA